MPLLAPKVLPGPLHSCNRGCSVWSHNSLFAYGSNSYVVVLDTQNLTVAQTLDEHRAVVTCLEWGPARLQADLDGPYHLSLASGDLHGNIIIWDVFEGTAQTSVSDPAISLPVAQMKWDPAHPNFLLVLYSAANYFDVSSTPTSTPTASSNTSNTPSTPAGSRVLTEEEKTYMANPSSPILQSDSLFALWDIVSGTKVWERKDLIASMFDLDPFSPSIMCVASSSGTISLISDYNLTRESETLFPQFHITSTSHGPKWRPVITYNLQKITDSQQFIRSQQEKPSPPLKDFHSIFFSPYESEVLYVVLDRAIFILDLQSQVELGRLSLDDPTLASFSDFRLSRVPNEIAFSLHNNGTIAMWHETNPPVDGIITSKDSVRKRTYHILVSSDNMRSKIRRSTGACLSIACDPVDGNSALGLHPDGTIFRFEYFSSLKSFLVTRSFESLPSSITSISFNSPSHLPAPSPISSSTSSSTSTSSSSSFTLAPNRNTTNSTSPTSLDSNRNSSVAAGTSSGMIYILNAITSKVIRQFSVTSDSIQDLKWISSVDLICFSSKKLENGRFQNKIWRV
jgi:hypothetical protein